MQKKKKKSGIGVVIRISQGLILASLSQLLPRLTQQRKWKLWL